MLQNGSVSNKSLIQIKGGGQSLEHRNSEMMVSEHNEPLELKQPNMESTFRF